MTRAHDDRKSRVLLGALVVAHLLIISRQVDAGGGVSLLEKAAFTALHPFQVVVSRTVSGVAFAWRSFVDLRGVRQENRRLQAELDGLQSELQQRRLQAEESERLRALLELRATAPPGSVAAEVVARSGLPWYRTFVVDRGTESNVALHAPVVCPAGLVGRVIAVAPGASKVQALLDQAAGVGVLVERSRVTGVVSGQVATADAAQPLLMMKYVPARADVVPGDTLVTSGFDRLYPKGLPVGSVSLVRPGSGLFQEIVVVPAAPFDRLEAVLILPATPPVPLAAEEPR